MARSSTTKEWPFLLVLLSWTLVLCVVGVMTFTAITGCVWLYRTVTGPVRQAEQVVVPKSPDCGPTSTTPCTEREARLQLQAEVDSFAKPTVQQHLEEIRIQERNYTDARIERAKARFEQEKAQWERERYREEREALRQFAPAPVAPAQRSDVSCNESAAARRWCDQM